jgi:type IV secretory pathway VirJ component
VTLGLSSGLAAAAAPELAAAPQRFSVPGAGVVTVYAPAAPPAGVVLFLSGDAGWTPTVAAMAERLTAQGALVVGVDVRAFRRSLDAAKTCAYPTGNIEEISRFVQQRLQLAAYQRPIIAGYAAGAAMAYAVVAAAPNDTLAGGIGVSFSPALALRVPLCHMRGLRATKRPQGGYALAPYAGSSIPWMVLQGQRDVAQTTAAVAQFVRSTGAARLFLLPDVDHGFAAPAGWEAALLEAYPAVAVANATHDVPRVTTAAVADLALVEVPAAGAGRADTMAIVLSGDGGWAELDQALARGFAARGIAVVGWSSLDYYWTPRTAEEASAALARIIDHYTSSWRRPRVIVVGYSFGADVAPFLVNRLPADARGHIATLGLLAPSARASFEFHVAGWLGVTTGTTFATRPEMARLTVATTCVSPEDDPAPACAPGNPQVRAVTAPAGHHFGGEYERLVQLLLESASPGNPSGR